MNKLITGITSAAIAAGIGLGVAQVANADDETEPTPSATTSQSPGADSSDRSGHAGPDRGRGPGGGSGFGLRGVDLSALAEELGVEESDLEDAFEAAREASRPSETQQSSEDTTDEEREAEREERQAAFVSALAEKLGLDEQSVTDALSALKEAAETERAEAQQEILDEAVAEGTLTQEEADALKKAADAGIVRIQNPGARR